MAVAMATWRSIISRIYGIDKHLDMESERKRKNKNDFKD